MVYKPTLHNPQNAKKKTETGKILIKLEPSPVNCDHKIPYQTQNKTTILSDQKLQVKSAVPNLLEEYS